MKNVVPLVALALLSTVATGHFSVARAADLPADLKLIVGSKPASAADLATKDILQLNATMFELYGDAGKIFTNNIRANHPIILGLFSGKGGRFILYRPGMPRSKRRRCPSTINS